MRVLIVTDIFGVTASVLSLANVLMAERAQVEVVDPYDGKEKSFSHEQSAYDAFLANCGHDSYFRKVQNAISSSLEDLVIIGFSAGASAVWRNMESDWQSNILHFVGFYPGQIRYHLHITPKYPCTIVFPNREEHFDVNDVSGILNEIDNVQCIITDYGHGFMNPLSHQYSSIGAGAFNKVINQASKLADVATLRRLLQR
jgi:dienelactone hydrolase